VQALPAVDLLALFRLLELTLARSGDCTLVNAQTDIDCRRVSAHEVIAVRLAYKVHKILPSGRLQRAVREDISMAPMCLCCTPVPHCSPDLTLRGSVATSNGDSGAALGKIAERQAAAEESEYSVDGS
jgi:hypothetical protein